MATIIRLILAISASIALLPAAWGQTSMNVTPIEIAQLPRFCWAQLQVPDAVGDDFRIRDCGPAANHFCSGLIYIIRARGNVKKQERFSLLARADIDVRYTEKAIADYPKCSIRDAVANARADVNNLLSMYGFKRPKQ